MNFRETPVCCQLFMQFTWKEACCSKQLALGTSPAILMTCPFVSVEEISSGLWSMGDRVRLRIGGVCISGGVQNDIYGHVLIWTGYCGVRLKQLLWSPSSKISPLCSQGQMQGSLFKQDGTLGKQNSFKPREFPSLPLVSPFIKLSWAALLLLLTCVTFQLHFLGE